jgi:hypothetical protein
MPAQSTTVSAKIRQLKQSPFEKGAVIRLKEAGTETSLFSGGYQDREN